jgi:hypothetical protein
VNARREGEMRDPARVTADVEPVGIAEPGRVTVRGPQQHDDDLAWLEAGARDDRRLERRPAV